MTKQQREFIEGFNYYVPAMQAAGDLAQSLEGRINFGAPAVADADAIAAAVDGDAAVATTAVDKEADAPFGRNVTCIFSGTPGADTEITIKGRDYLGQQMTEVITVTGTSTVNGVKAFKHVDSYAGDGGATNAVTINIGWGGKLGVPYKTIAVNAEYEDQVKAGTTGTLTAPVLTDPQTATTGDPRGLITPNGTLDGTAVFEFDLSFSSQVNASNNGGLHGIAHYNA